MRAALILCLWLIFPCNVAAQSDPLQEAHQRTIEALQSGDTVATIKAAEDALSVARTLPDPPPEGVLWAYNNLGHALRLADKGATRARSLFEEALALAKTQGLAATQPALTIRVNLATMLGLGNELDQAKRLIEEGMALARDGPFQADFANARAEHYLTHGPYTEAAIALSEVLAINPEVLRNSYGDLYVRLSRLSEAAEAEGLWADALPLIEVRIKILETLYPDELDRQDGIKTLFFQRYFAANQLGRYEPALEYLRVWLSMAERFDEDDQSFVVNQIATLSQLGDWDGMLDADGINLLRQLPLLLRINRSTATAMTGRTLIILADGEQRFGRTQEADRMAALAQDILGTASATDRQTARKTERPEAETPLARAEDLYRQAQELLDGDTPNAAVPPANALIALADAQGGSAQTSRWAILRASAEQIKVDASFLTDQPVSVDRLIDALEHLRVVGHDSAHDLAITLGEGAARVLFVAGEPAARPYMQAASAAFDDVKSITPDLLEARQFFSSSALLTGDRAMMRNELTGVTEMLKSPDFRHVLPASLGVFEQLAWALLDTPTPPSTQDIDAALGALQWTQINRSADAVQFLETRLSVNDPARSGLLRQRQRLEEEAAQMASRLTPGDPVQETAYQETRIALSRVDASLNALGVDLLGVSAVRPVSLSDIQAMIEPGEMVVTFVLPGLKPEMIPGLEISSNHVMGITQDDVHIARMSEVSRNTLRERVQAFRCQVAVSEPGCAQSATEGLRGLFSVSSGTKDKKQSFDFDAAHALYRDLFGGLDVALSGTTHLIVVPPSDLLRLPFQAMVTTAKNPERLADADWLIKTHAVSVLPSLTALRTLRKGPEPNKRFDHMIGFGDPLVGSDLPPMDCEAIQTAALRSAPKMGSYIVQDPSTAVPLADVRQLRTFDRLPDTVCELQAIRSTLDGTSELLLGAGANEAAVKELDRQGDLEKADILVFATHGLTAGESGAAAPGLLMTPPDQASLVDDGLLSAPEIAMMKLNADLVILSACNTAAGDHADQDGLSGLARAFFQAGARSLLVTHWSVFSDAAVEVSTGMLVELKKDPEQLYAKALQRSVLAILEDPSRRALEHHPAYWAAFFVVGAT